MAIEYDEFTAFLAVSFSHRRKKLRNNLLRGLPIEPETLDRIFQELGIQQNDRAENLAPPQYEKLILAMRPLNQAD